MDATERFPLIIEQTKTGSFNIIFPKNEDKVKPKKVKPKRKKVVPKLKVITDAEKREIYQSKLDRYPIVSVLEGFEFSRVEYFEPIESNDLIEPILCISLNEMELLAKEVAFADMGEWD